MEVGFQIYVNDSGKALEFYKRAFNAKLRGDIHWQPEHKGAVIVHAELDVFGKFFLAIADLDFGSGERDEKGFHIPVTGNTMQIFLSSLSKNDVYKIYEVLKEGVPHNPPGEVDWGESGFTECCFGLVDKYGVKWHIST